MASRFANKVKGAASASTLAKGFPWITLLTIAFEWVAGWVGRCQDETPAAKEGDDPVPGKTPAEIAALARKDPRRAKALCVRAVRESARENRQRLGRKEIDDAAEAMLAEILKPDLEDAIRETKLDFSAFGAPGVGGDQFDRGLLEIVGDQEGLRAAVLDGYALSVAHQLESATDGDLKRSVRRIRSFFGGKMPNGLGSLANDAESSPEQLRKLCRILDRSDFAPPADGDTDGGNEPGDGGDVASE